MRRSTISRRRRLLLGGTVAAGLGLATAATAFACIYMQGTFTVCGDAIPPTYSQCTTSTGTSPTTKHNFSFTQSGSTSISAVGTARVSATGLTPNHAYWIKYWDPAQAAAMQTANGWANWCPKYGRAVGNPAPQSYLTDATGGYGPAVVALGASTVGTGYMCTTDNETDAGSNGNTAAVTIVP